MDLPEWNRVLVVVAHPDDESFGLGALISTFVQRGSVVTVLCFTHGEASTLHGVDGDLAEVRARELADAADALGVTSVELRDFPDGALPTIDIDALARIVVEAGAAVGADGLLTFDDTGITGHPDHQHATLAATTAGAELGIGVLGWTIPERVAEQLRTELGAGFIGRATDEIDVVVRVDRARQGRAVDCHPSQAVPGSALWRRLELEGDQEYARWVLPIR